MNPDAEILSFADRASFRAWLTKNRSRDAGIWIAFEKGSKRFTALDALEEALCFGWIDGVMKSVDDKTYRKYFSPRRDTAKWSDKNMALYADLAKRGLMTDAGVAVYKPSSSATADSGAKADAMAEKILTLKAALSRDAEALRLFQSKPPSRQKQFAGFYGDAKTDATRAKRIATIAQALREGFTGMLK
jgi:uncharacterized protein YdeI (YjbR/CyaY-like superfamily)